MADQFAVHWPFKQPKAGRGLRKSALHDRWVAAGAHFGLTGGWERGLWYAETAEEASLPYSVAAPHPWQQIAEREAAAMEEGCALIDLSPFGKFDVIGYEALEALQELACANLDVAEGRAVYTPLLNAMGGIEADVTITRLGEHAFRITSAAATRWRDAAFLRRHLAGRADLQDVTEDYSVIGVMGAASRRLLEGLSEGDWTAFLFSTARPMTVAEKSVLATRLSFVGELGWELTIRNDDAPVIFDALLASGARPMGHYALEACRIEKGFHAWGHDLGPEVTPLEAGLGFTIDWSKPFIGKDALEAQRAKGLSRRLVLMEVDAGALILHDEPVWANGEVVGLTTSGGIGARTGLTLAFAMIETEPGETLGQTCERRFELEVGARRYAARSLRRPPFDPDGQRMRA
ncbi:MAG: aminomethyltransferase family protein [Pseudomonadota bacterium]